MEPVRITAQEAREKVKSGSLLVCGYEDESECRSMLLEGAITFGEFQKKLPSLSKDQGIIFYCA
jgi:hypothetical protein